MKNLFVIFTVLLVSCDGQGTSPDGLTSSAQAQVILDSHAVYNTGDRLEFDAIISLSEGQKLQVFLPNRKTKVFNGPIEGVLSDLVKSESVVDLITQIPRDMVSKSGNDRMASFRNSGEKRIWALNQIPLSIFDSEVFCFPDMRKVFLVRDSYSSESVTISITNDNASKSINFPSGENISIEWPIETSETGVNRISSTSWFSDSTIVIKKVESFELPELVANNCRFQVQNLLRFASEPGSAEPE